MKIQQKAVEWLSRKAAQWKATRQKSAQRRTAQRRAAQQKAIQWLSFLFGLVILAIAIWQVTIGIREGISQREIEVMTGIWIGIAIIAALSFKIIGPAEMAVAVVLGIPKWFCDSGPWFIPFWPLSYLKRYPKKMYNFDYEKREVVTRAGEYRGTHYGSQVLKVDAVGYLNFPREKRSERTGDDPELMNMLDRDKEAVEKTHPLIKILRAQVDVEDEKLRGWTEEAVVGALRVAFGKITWRQAVEDIEEVTKEAERVFREANGALIRAGFSKKGIRLVVAEIILPDKLQQAMPDVDRQRLEAEAAPFEAEQRAIETVGTMMEMFCQETGLPRPDVEREFRENPEEFVRKHEKVWEKNWDILHRRMGIDGGAYLDIRTVAGEPGKTLLELIGAWKRMPSGNKGTTPAEAEAEAEASTGDRDIRDIIKEVRKK